MTDRKSFFQERTARQILKLKHSPASRVYKPRGLVERIDNLGPDEALLIHIPIIPGIFYRRTQTMAEGSRKAYHHGDLISLSHPKTQSACDACPDIPLEIRARDFAKLKELNEEEISFIGYSFHPQWGDKKKRAVNFVSLPEAIRLFGYAEIHSPISVRPYDDALKVKLEGASVVLEVPSRTKKKPRYKFKLQNVPVQRNDRNLATILNLTPATIIENGEIVNGRTPHDLYNIRYTYETDREGSNIINLINLDIAGYVAIIRHYNEKHNLTPIDMNPFALPSKHQAHLYNRMINNVLIMDPSIKSDKPEEKYRKLHLAEKAILLSRAIKVFGHDDFCFWDPIRDGKLKDYDWSIPK